jgi:hypothetical protein
MLSNKGPVTWYSRESTAGTQANDWCIVAGVTTSTPSLELGETIITRNYKLHNFNAPSINNHHAVLTHTNAEPTIEPKAHCLVSHLRRQLLYLETTSQLDDISRPKRVHKTEFRMRKTGGGHLLKQDWHTAADVQTTLNSQL